MTDIKKDTLKNQLDDALRQWYNPTLMINPEMAVVQLNTIMDEQCIKFAEWMLQEGVKKYTDKKWKLCGSNQTYNTPELLHIFKQENGL